MYESPPGHSQDSISTMLETWRASVAPGHRRQCVRELFIFLSALRCITNGFAHAETTFACVFGDLEYLNLIAIGERKPGLAVVKLTLRLQDIEEARF